VRDALIDRFKIRSREFSDRRTRRKQLGSYSRAAPVSRRSFEVEQCSTPGAIQPINGTGRKMRLIWRNTLMASVLSASLNGGLEAEPTAGSRSNALGGG
jgi:hypothetical protein